MKAFVLAAGLGTRLRPLTDHVPKCLVPVGGRPLLDLWLDGLSESGVDDVLVNVHHMADRVRAHLAGRRGTPRVRVSHEPTLLGSAGTLVANREFVGSDEVFLAVNGDNLTDFDVRGLVCALEGAPQAEAAIAREVLLGKSIVLLLGGLIIGWVAGAEGIRPVEPLFMDLFKGVLALFLLEMGLIAAGQAGSLRRHGAFLVVFGIAMPLVAGALGAGLGWGRGLSVGGTALLATLMASASYIAVPAAMRLSVPEANPALSLAASLGITFPFNIVIGIPLYHRFAEYLYRLGG